MDTKSLNFRQVCCAQEHSHYYFQIDYCQGKVNTAENALLRFFQRSQDEGDEFSAENSQIFYCLQISLTNASLANFSLFVSSYLHQVFICKTYILPQLQQFWKSLQEELAQKRPYIIGNMSLKL